MTVVNKPVLRETSTIYRRRPLCVAVHPRHLEIWEKGRRDRLTVGYEAVYELALKVRWRQEQSRKGKQ